MSYPEDDPGLFFVAVTSLDTTRSGEYLAMVNMPWVVHPEKGLVFYQQGGCYYPQANMHVMVTNKLAQDLYPWAKVEVIPLVLLRRSGAPLTKECLS